MTANSVSNEDIIAMVRSATHEVFATMMGLALEEGEPHCDHAALAPREGIVALVGLAGDWIGTGSLSCSAEMARNLSGSFLMQEFTSVDEEVLDAMGEIANMIFGNVKTALEERLGPMGLSIPTVIFGRNITTRSIGKSDWNVVPFLYEGQNFEIRVCLARGNKKDGPQRLMPAISIVE
jgi:chemotaxis protein CheX